MAIHQNLVLSNAAVISINTKSGGKGFIVNGTVVINNVETKVSFFTNDASMLDGRELLINHDDDVKVKYPTSFQGYKLHKVLSFAEKMELAGKYKVNVSMDAY